MNIVAIDFESYLIDANNIYPKPVCLSYYDGSNAFLLRKTEMLPFLKKTLEKDTFIAHNATFECGVIYYHFPELRELMFTALDEGRIICTMINEQTNSVTAKAPIHNFSLAALVKKYYGKDISDTKGADSWRLRYNELEDVEEWPQEAIDYALSDSIYAFKIYFDQPIVDSLLSTKSSVYLNIMASKGMKVDTSRVEELRQEILTHLKPHYGFLLKERFCIEEKGKIKKKIKLLKEHVEKLGIEIKYTKKGAVSVDGESLEVYRAQKEDEVLKAFSEIAVYEKVLTAYISNLQAETVYTQYSTVKTTGRTSASKSSFYPSLNIQQMPRQVPNVSYDVRNCFVPREGKKIVSIDYAGLELAATAHQLYKVYKKSAMRDIINSGDGPVDMHSKLAAYIKKIPYEEFMAKKKEYKEERQLAKPINLGFPGGIGYDTMRHLLWQSGIKTKFNIIYKTSYKNDAKHFLFKLKQDGNMDLRIARISKTEWAIVQDELVKLKRDFFDLYPDLEKFLKETHLKYVTGQVKKIKNEFDEWEEEPMYKYNVNGFKRDWCVYTAFCNGFLMQTPSAVGAKETVCTTVRRFDGNPDITPLAFIHDEILFEVTEDRKDLIDEAANIMIDKMQSVLTSVRITVEASMSDYWQKADGFWTKTYFKNNIE